MTSVRPAHDHDFADMVLGSAVPVVVGFHASGRATSAQSLIGVLDELSAAGHDIGVVRVDVDEAPRTSTAYGISMVPSVVVFSGGVMVLALPGVPSHGTVLHLLRAALPAAVPSAELS